LAGTAHQHATLWARLLHFNFYFLSKLIISRFLKAFSLDLLQQILCPSSKEFMFKDVLLLSSDLVKVIHVKLPHERCKILVPEIDGKDFFLRIP